MTERFPIAEQAIASITRCVVQVNDLGCAIGESHWRAKISDADVDMIRTLREDHGWSYRRLGARFGISHGQARNICKYQQRAHLIMGHKTIKRTLKGQP